jgi:hypothetical protein
MRFPIKSREIVIVPIKYGAIGGLLLIVLFIALDVLDQNPLVNAKKIDILLFLIFIFFCTKEYRDVYNHRSLTFWDGMLCGSINFLVMAVISAAFILLFTRFLKTGMVDDYIHNTIGYLEDNKEQFLEKENVQTYNQLISDVESTTARDLALDDFLKKSRIGIFLTIIVAVILKKSPR